MDDASRVIDPAPEPLRGRRRPSSRLRLAIAGVAMAVAVSSAGMSVWWVGFAQPDSFETADAVVVHAGQRHRLQRGLELVDQGVAPLLVLLHGLEVYEDADRLCRPQGGYDVICPTPERGRTIGEAAEINRLADELGWESAVVVTSDYHLRRARYIDRKCTDIEIHADVARRHNPRPRRRSIVQEVVSMTLAFVEPCG